MPDQWDRFALSASQTIDALGFHQNVEIYDATESYTTGEGYDITYPDDPTEVVSGETLPPSAESNTDRGGTTREADLIVHVPTGYATDIDDSGESGEALTRIKVAGTTAVYEVLVVERQFDGINKLVCAEVDT